MGDFGWTDAQIRWAGDASKRSKLYYWIAEHISAYLPPSARVFNAGGGLGDLAVWLSYHVEQVTVIEKDPKAVAALRARCPHNVVAILGDVLAYSPDKLYDALVLYEIGGAERVLPIVRELSRAKTFLLLSRETAQGEADIRELTDMLKRAGVPFVYEPLEQEHVQPFFSREEAKAYFLAEQGRAVADDALDGLLRAGGDAALPLELCERRKLGMIVFDAANPALKKLSI